MTVAALPREAEYLGNGATTAFAAPFRYLSGALRAELIDADGTITALTRGVDYSATSGDTDAGGTVTMGTAPATGQRLRIYSQTGRAQVTDYDTNDTFPAESHELALDRLAMVDQEQDGLIGDVESRAIRVPAGETVAVLPGPISRKAMLLGFSAFDGTLALIERATFKGDPGGNVMAIGPYVDAPLMAVPIGTDLVRTSGYAVDGDGGAADFAYSAVEPATGPKFQDSAGRWFGLAEASPNSYQFGVGLADNTATQNTERAQAFLDYIEAVGCTLPQMMGKFTVSGALTLNLNQNTTGGILWNAQIYYDGDPIETLLTMNASGAGCYVLGCLWMRGLPPGSTSRAFSVRKVNVAVKHGSSGRLNVIATSNLLYFRFAGHLVTTGGIGLNSNLSSIGPVTASSCGSGGVLAGAALEANWSDRVDNGTTGTTGQSTVLTVDTLPPTDIEALLGPMMVVIAGMTHYISAIDRPNSKITIFPWPGQTASTSGTLSYLWGGGVVTRGGDSNLVGVKMLDVTHSGAALVSASLYPVIIERLHSASNTASMILGSDTSSAHVSLSIRNFYTEGNSAFEIVRLSRADVGLHIDSGDTYNTAAWAKNDYPCAPWVTASARRATSSANLRSCTLNLTTGFHQYVKTPLNDQNASSSLSFYPHQVPNNTDLIFKRDSWTINLMPLEMSMNQMFGYDSGKIGIIGTGTDGAPTGTITFNPPSGWTVNGGASAAFSGLTAPANFLIYYDIAATNVLVGLT